MKLYVASSWKNPVHPEVVEKLRVRGYDVYDFRESNAFNWRDIPGTPPLDQGWPLAKVKKALSHSFANAGFETDYDALERCDALVLVLPCGNDAHLEAGWCVGRKKPVFIYGEDHPAQLAGHVPGLYTPGLMYKLAEISSERGVGGIVTSFEDLCEGLTRVRASLIGRLCPACKCGTSRATGQCGACDPEGHTQR